MLARVDLPDIVHIMITSLSLGRDLRLKYSSITVVISVNTFSSGVHSFLRDWAWLRILVSCECV